MPREKEAGYIGVEKKCKYSTHAVKSIKTDSLILDEVSVDIRQFGGQHLFSYLLKCQKEYWWHLLKGLQVVVFKMQSSILEEDKNSNSLANDKNIAEMRMFRISKQGQFIKNMKLKDRHIYWCKCIKYMYNKLCLKATEYYKWDFKENSLWTDHQCSFNPLLLPQVTICVWPSRRQYCLWNFKGTLEKSQFLNMLLVILM